MTVLRTVKGDWSLACPHVAMIFKARKEACGMRLARSMVPVLLILMPRHFAAETHGMGLSWSLSCGGWALTVITSLPSCKRFRVDDHSSRRSREHCILTSSLSRTVLSSANTTWSEVNCLSSRMEFENMPWRNGLLMPPWSTPHLTGMWRPLAGSSGFAMIEE